VDQFAERRGEEDLGHARERVRRLYLRVADQHDGGIDVAHCPVAPEPELIGLAGISTPSPSDGLLFGVIEKAQADLSHHAGHGEADTDHRHHDQEYGDA